MQKTAAADAPVRRVGNVGLAEKKFRDFPSRARKAREAFAKSSYLEKKKKSPRRRAWFNGFRCSLAKIQRVKRFCVGFVFANSLFRRFAKRCGLEVALFS